MKSFSRVQLLVTQWTVAYQAPLPMGFSRQDYWSGLPFLSPGDLPNPGIEPRSAALQTCALPSEPPIVGGVFQKLYKKCLCLQYLPLFHLDSGLAVFNGEIKWESMQFCNMGTKFQSTHLGWRPLLHLWVLCILLWVLFTTCSYKVYQLANS